jgi:predicted helicase
LVGGVTHEIPDIDMRGGVYAYPLMVNGKPNFSKTFLTSVNDQFGKLFDPETLLGYIYSILYCNAYRKKYGSELRTCFPRIPLTPDKELFIKISSIGKELIELHLLSSRKIGQSMAGFPDIGNDIVEKVLYDSKNFRVMINDKQYFSKVEPDVWKYEVGGYRVCERWLRERNGRKLNSDDQTVFMRMIGSIKETLKLQQELDALFPQIELNVVTLAQTIEQQKLMK